ncbi:MAG TPA: hypothetical protein EYQ86_09575 [Bacteroidetes bacterium]|nr:hypothetical protein [Bacteroidota bacterium]
MKQSLILTLLCLIFNTTSLYAVSDYYWVGDSTQNGSGHWDTLSNWVYAATGQIPTLNDIATQIPGPDDNVYISKLFQDSNLIHIKADSFSINGLIVNVDSLKFAFDEGRVKDSIRFSKSLITYHELLPNNEYISYLESSPDLNTTSIITMSGVIYKDGDFLKTGPGTTVLNKTLSLDIDTADYSNG